MTTNNRNKVLLIHGLFLLAVTGMNTIVSLIGLTTGTGLFAFIKDIPLAEVGLLQAYLLMMLVGIVLLMNTKSENSWKYDLVGVVAHLIPLTALFLFQDVVKEIMGVRIFIASAIIHIPWVIIELITAYVQYNQTNGKQI
jgi:hypothetical protein